MGELHTNFRFVVGNPLTLFSGTKQSHSFFIRTLSDRKKIFVANITSQIKRNRTNKKAQERNKAVKSELRTTIRAVRNALEAQDKTKATQALVLASKKLDKAVSKGVIHKNQAANKKSSLAKQVAAL